MSNLRIATDPEGISALRRLADLLDRVAHPSIVAIEDARFEPRRAELSLASTKGTPLSQISLGVEPLMRTIAATFASLAHLHDRDVVLHTVDTATIVVRSDNSVVIGGFDNAIENASPADKTRDIEQLAAIARSQLPAADPLRSRINNDCSIEMGAAFETILDNAVLGKLDARSVAEQIRHALWFDSKPRSTKLSPRHQRLKTDRISRPFNRSLLALRQTTKRKVAFSATSILAIAISIGTAQFASRPKATTTKPDDSSCQLRTNATMDVDGDGCMDSLHIDAGIVTVNNERFTAGTAQDKFLVGDWQCDNRPTLLMLQTATGAIYTFDTWPLAGMQTNARLVATVPGASSIEKYRHNTCDVPTVHAAQGSQEIDMKKVKP